MYAKAKTKVPTVRSEVVVQISLFVNPDAPCMDYVLGGETSSILEVHPNLVEIIQFDLGIFFRWVSSSTNYRDYLPKLGEEWPSSRGMT